MFWQKLAWRAYKILGRVVLTIPLVRLPLGSQTLGQRLSMLARRLFCATLPNPMVAYGHTIYWGSRSYLYAPEFASQSYEQDTFLFSQSLIHPGMTIVDLGAHIGLYSLLAANLVGQKGRVYAFEPLPSNYALLLKNISTNGYEDIIKGVNKAVSDKPDPVSLFLGERDSGENSMYAVPGVGTESVVVTATTLDNFFNSEGWPAVDLIKMDIEGAEKAALDGMKELVKRNQSLKLIIEFNPGLQAAAGVSNEEFFDTLTGVGFQKIWVLQNGLQLISIPQHIPRLVQMAGNSYINLFCEK